jgi:hypothetical protein
VFAGKVKIRLIVAIRFSNDEMRATSFTVAACLIGSNNRPVRKGIRRMTSTIIGLRLSG